VRELDIRWDTVIVRKAGEIIPEVVRVLPELRPHKIFQMPVNCLYAVSQWCDRQVRQHEGALMLPVRLSSRGFQHEVSAMPDINGMVKTGATAG